MKVYIVTGASRGLGEAIVESVMQEGNRIFCMARSTNEKLVKKAADQGVSLSFINVDFNDLNATEDQINKILSEVSTSEVEEITLINNAGVVNPIKPIEKCTAAELERNVNVNLLAPMMFTSLFISEFQTSSVKKTIVNISSGAAKRSVFGWSAYCSTKAGLDSFTQTVGLEQSHTENPTKIISFAPGVVDTEMQSEIRSSQKEDFIDVESFQKLKKDEALLKPKEVAEKLLQLLRTDIKQGGIYDVRQL